MLKNIFSKGKNLINCSFIWYISIKKKVGQDGCIILDPRYTDSRGRVALVFSIPRARGARQLTAASAVQLVGAKPTLAVYVNNGTRTSVSVSNEYTQGEYVRRGLVRCDWTLYNASI